MITQMQPSSSASTSSAAPTRQARQRTLQQVEAGPRPSTESGGLPIPLMLGVAAVAGAGVLAAMNKQAIVSKIDAMLSRKLASGGASGGAGQMQVRDLRS